MSFVRENWVRMFLLLVVFSIWQVAWAQNGALVFQSDFGLKDGAVSAMKGVAFSVSPELEMFDVTHEIETYNIAEAAYRLNQAAPYWPTGTVFVSIVDPGVGSARKSIVLKTKSGHFFVSPDNGTLTLVANSLGVEEVRTIDEASNRLKNSDQSYTFHGRDVYAYTGARLAARVITFEGVGPQLKSEIVRLSVLLPTIKANEIYGTIPVLDVQFGNVWTNIDGLTLRQLEIKAGDVLHVRIYQHDALKFEGDLPLVSTFASVAAGKELAYLNSLLNFSVAINQGNFSERYHIKSGEGWTIHVRKK
jgi:S-adenosylmethionine hydrolase